jgi:glycosyltransferase involved in cell wall biosynthesis
LQPLTPFDRVMSVLIFLTSTPATVADGSGTWVGISGLRDAVMALGHEVILVNGGEGSGDGWLGRVAFNLRSRFRIARMRADVLVGFDLDGVFVARGLFRHVAALKGVLADEARHERGTSRFSLRILARLESLHARRAGRVLTTSGYSADRIASFYGTSREKIAVVPELIDLQSWDRLLEQEPRSDGPPCILSVAHLYPRKGLDVLLSAFTRVPPPAVLRIVGTGPERERLDHLAQELGVADRVSFLGHLPFQALAEEYRNATIFALPSEQEGFGIVFLEAMASSLPVVAARAAAVPEVVVEGVTALLADPDDDAELARHLVRLLDDAPLRASMGSSGRAHVLRYDAPVVAQQFLDAIGLA